MNQGFDQQLHDTIASGNEIGAIKLLRQQQKLPLGTARERAISQRPWPPDL